MVASAQVKNKAVGLLIGTCALCVKRISQCGDSYATINQKSTNAPFRSSYDKVKNKEFAAKLLEFAVKLLTLGGRLVVQLLT